MSNKISGKLQSQIAGAVEEAMKDQGLTNKADIMRCVRNILPSKK
jgi:hypothetical protein